MKKVVAYARYSSDNQRQESIEAQLFAIRNYCEQKEYFIIKEYIDEEVSGTTDSRDNFLEMISESSDLDYDYVVVHKLDRFARNRYDSAIYKKLLEKNGKGRISVLENLDNSPEGIMMEAVLEGMAEYYSKNLAREVKKGMELNARRGQHTGGKPPFGYDTNDGYYIINKEEADTVRNIFLWVSQGIGLRTISDKLSEFGIKNKFGRDFSHTSLHYLLRNKKYIGVYEYQPTAPGFKRDKYYRDENCIIIENNHEPIIDLSLWNLVQSTIGEVKPRMNNKSKTYHLTGKIVCGQCGASYHGDGWDGKRYTYACSNRRNGCKNKRVNAEKIERFIIDHVKANYLTDDQIRKTSKEAASIMREFKDNSKEKEKDLSAQITVIDTKIDLLFDKLLDNLIDDDILSEQVKRLKTQKEKLVKMRDIVIESSRDVDLELAYTLLNRLKDIDLGSPNDDIKLLINTFIDTVVIGGKDGISEVDDVSVSLHSIVDIVGGSVRSASPAPLKLITRLRSLFFIH